MKPKRLYLRLCVACTLLPYSQPVPFLREHGLDLRLFVEQPGRAEGAAKALRAI